MTVNELINAVRALRATAQTDGALVQYLNEIEGRVQTEGLGVMPEDIVEYTAGKDAALIVEPPYDKLYIYYVAAMVDFGDGEFRRYENTSQMADAAYCEWAKWRQRTKG